MFIDDQYNSYHNTQTHVLIIKIFFVNILSTDTLKPACEQMMVSLTFSSKWVEKQTHDKITKDGLGCGELTSMAKVKKHLPFQNN